MKTQFHDPAAAAICKELQNEYGRLYSSGKVFRGKYNTDHVGAAHAGEIHIDPFYFDMAATGEAGWIRILADAVLHEAAHVLGKYGHHGGETQPPYSSFPYNHLTGGAAEQCVG